MAKSNLHSDLKKNKTQQTRNRRELLQMDKGYLQKKNLKSASHSKIKNKTKMSVFTPFIQHYNEGYNPYNKVRNKNQRHKYQKARSKRKKMT